jgi:hypothetical protein
MGAVALRGLGRPLVWTVLAAGMVGFGVTMLLLSLAYTRDLAALAQVPAAVWQFVCGLPVAEGNTAPLLTGLGGISGVVGLVFAVLARYRSA